jgi:hypothetical protein
VEQFATFLTPGPPTKLPEIMGGNGPVDDDVFAARVAPAVFNFDAAASARTPGALELPIDHGPGPKELAGTGRESAETAQTARR